MSHLHGSQGFADLLRDVDEEVLDLLVLQAEGQHAARQRPEVGLDLVARPRRHLRGKRICQCQVMSRISTKVV